MIRRRRSARLPASAAVCLAVSVVLAGCTTTTPGDDDGSALPELTATATVREEQGRGGPVLCAGAIDTSYPVRCGGPVIEGWDWDAVDGEDAAAGVTWGEYRVVGTWDGTVFTLTRPAAAPVRPSVDAGPPVAWPDPASDEQVERALADYRSREQSVTGIYGSGGGGGRASVQVLYDDGTMQAEADARYGPDVVVIESALRPVGSAAG
jgi:hypothetical protein